MGEVTYAVDLKNCAGHCVPNVYVVNAYDGKKLEQTIKEAVASDEIAVIIAQAPCVCLRKHQ